MSTPSFLLVFCYVLSFGLLSDSGVSWRWFYCKALTRNCNAASEGWELSDSPKSAMDLSYESDNRGPCRGWCVVVIASVASKRYQQRQRGEGRRRAGGCWLHVANCSLKQANAPACCLCLVLVRLKIIVLPRPLSQTQGR